MHIVIIASVERAEPIFEYTRATKGMYYAKFSDIFFSLLMDSSHFELETYTGALYSVSRSAKISNNYDLWSNLSLFGTPVYAVNQIR